MLAALEPAAALEPGRRLTDWSQWTCGATDLSEKPRDGYGDSQAVGRLTSTRSIQALELDHPVLCGWSYGPLVILDYLRHYGEDGIGGIHFVGGNHEARQ